MIITCYNYASYLPDAVSSVLQQTHPAHEIIIVDDGSTDDTAKVAQQWEDAGAICVHQDNSGLSAARNKGVANASGEHVVFLDADDQLAPAYLERCLAALEANPEAGYAYTQWQAFGSEHGVSEFPDFSPQELRVVNYIHASAMIRTRLVRAYPFYTKLRFWEDWDFYLTLLDHGVTGVLVDEPLLMYRRHTESMTMVDAAIGQMVTHYRLRLTLVRRHPHMLAPQALRTMRRAPTVLRRLRPSR